MGACVFWMAPGAASAQSVDALLGALHGGSDPGAAVPEELERRSLEVASASFEHAARRMALRLAGPDDADAGVDADGGLVERARSDFVADARAELVDSKGAGILTRKELSDAFDDAREEQLEALSEALRARVEGAEPPPRAEDFDATRSFVWAAARYTLAERNAPWRWLLCLGLLAVGLAAAGMAARSLGWLSERLDGRGADLAARASERLAGPFYLAGTAIAVRLSLEWVWVPVGTASAVGTATTAMLALAVLGIAWNGASDVARLFTWTVWRTRGPTHGGGAPDRDSIDVVRKSVRIVALALFAIFVVEALLGADLSSILAAVGVLGIVASIAAQDTLRNLMASFTLHGDRPFGVGDLVRCQGHFGNVEEIGFRSTRIRTLEGPEVVVPNAELVREPIENVSARAYVRHHDAIDLVYATPPKQVERALEVLREILEAADPPEDQPPRVAFESLGAHSLRLSVWYHSDTGDYWEAQEHRSRVNLEILSRFGEEGLEFAFPTRSLHLIPGEGAAQAPDDED
jgi:small-conductance mechanosensitive channel